ncbi:enoyl-CoA hydratase/isomerase family protein [Halomonas sp. 3H]|uniref:enoyl-CoA hydratase/isomerase family protein n=1 Tax=Halomonas sp. 3H TaxID=2952527 RepID=UPI0020B7B1A4|nr:enoyl-CoA hydratase/isomerase family protein [Halomonas sp. 3H]
MGIEVFQGGGGIARITIDNPSRRNALDITMFRDLADAWRVLDADRSVRCVILRGSGEEAFCSGADLSVDWDACQDRDVLIDQALLKSRVFSKPIIAAINGHCVAGGFELALAADIRVARTDARFGLPEVRWGIFPSGGGALKLTRQIPRALAMELLLTGRLISAERACESGFLNAVVASSALDDWALSAAEAICSNSPAAVQAVRAFCAGLELGDPASSAQALREQTCVDRVRESGDWREGVAAFLEKRTPDYPDR